MIRRGQWQHLVSKTSQSGTGHTTEEKRGSEDAATTAESVAHGGSKYPSRNWRRSPLRTRGPSLGGERNRKVMGA